jgi:3-oxoacyl-[acyl-carrier protein] reductase
MAPSTAPRRRCRCLKASGQASVINIGGLTAHTTAASPAVHVVTAKAGLVGMTRALATELFAQCITVNCVAPGLIDTARVGTKVPHHPCGAAHPGRPRRAPEEVAAAVCWLAGPNSALCHGAGDAREWPARNLGG